MAEEVAACCHAPRGRWAHRCYSSDDMSTLALDPYVVDVLLPDLVGHDRSPAAFLVYIYLWGACR
jgi:hypothetical protein